MDDEDYRALIQLVENQLREVGLAEVADPINYMDDGYEDGEPRRSIETPRLLPPRNHLIALLDAFDTQLMLRDQAVVNKSIRMIDRYSDGRHPTGAVVYGAGGEPVFDLKELPDLYELRSELQNLILKLRSSEDFGPESGDFR